MHGVCARPPPLIGPTSAAGQYLDEMRRLLMRTGIVLAVVASVAACGGAAYTKRDFIARADAICSSALRQTRALAPGTGLARYAAAVLPIVRSEAAQLRDLRRPPGDAHDQTTLTRYYAALGQVVQDYRELAAAAARGDDQGVASAEAALRASPAASLAVS
jgi:hypothetical protein